MPELPDSRIPLSASRRDDRHSVVWSDAPLLVEIEGFRSSAPLHKKGRSRPPRSTCELAGLILATIVAVGLLVSPVVVVYLLP